MDLALNKIIKFPSKTYLVLTILCISSIVFSQEAAGISFNYETFPSVKLADPIAESEKLEIQASSWSTNAAFPLMFGDGKIIIYNNLTYQRVDFSYKNFPVEGTKIKQAQSVKFSSFMIDSLSEKWSFVLALTPGLASDFEGDITMDDFTLEAVTGFIRKYSKTFQLGAGLAYARDFGTPLPMPFIYLDWIISPKLHLGGLVPINMALTYKLNEMIDLGFAFKVKGDRYHGNPDLFDTKNPQMEYSEGTLSPFLRLHFSKWIHLNIEGGFAPNRNFEFLDGDKSVQSLDLESTGYLRAGLVLGI